MVLARFQHVTFILSFFFFFPNYLFWAVLGFHSFAQDFFSCSEQGYSFVMLPSASLR